MRSVERAENVGSLVESPWGKGRGGRGQPHWMPKPAANERAASRMQLTIAARDTQQSRLLPSQPWFASVGGDASIPC